MKTPRITDFDPNAKAHTLKSSLDNMPMIQKPHPANGFQTPPLHSERHEVVEQHSSQPPVPRSVPRPVPGTPYPVKGA